MIVGGIEQVRGLPERDLPRLARVRMGAHEFVEQFVSSEIVAAVYVLAGVSQGAVPIAFLLRIERLNVRTRDKNQERNCDGESFLHPSSSAYRYRLAPPRRAAGLRWKRNDKRRALADRAVDLYMAAMGFDDFFRNRQA